ncbi:hypothetical protein QCA50_018901 [Cerrena zonata]|uniref:Ribonuclease H1 N-terminal domain-containing protein n=1 Tax=Cerrena zonata TaxID=2478898 RepID=A0AAW0FKF6_9APHY
MASQPGSLIPPNKLPTPLQQARIILLGIPQAGIWTVDSCPVPPVQGLEAPTFPIGIYCRDTTDSQIAVDMLPLIRNAEGLGSRQEMIEFILSDDLVCRRFRGIRKYYAALKSCSGHPCIYLDWADAYSDLDQYPGAIFNLFNDFAHALAYMIIKPRLYKKTAVPQQVQVPTGFVSQGQAPSDATIHQWLSSITAPGNVDNARQAGHVVAPPPYVDARSSNQVTEKQHGEPDDEAGEPVKILLEKPEDTLPAPCFGKDLNEYVDSLALSTGDLWTIYDVYAAARWDKLIPIDERMNAFVTNMTQRGLSILEAQYIWKWMVTKPGEADVRTRWSD